MGFDFRWDQELSKLKKQSRDIHNLWKKIGRPRTGLINAERLRIKCLHKRGVTNRKHTFENDRKKWLAYQLPSGNSRGSGRDGIILSMTYVMGLNSHFKIILLINGLGMLMVMIL